METIKKAADRYVGHPQEIDEDLTASIRRQSFIDGAKWAIEHIQDLKNK